LSIPLPKMVKITEIRKEITESGAMLLIFILVGLSGTGELIEGEIHMIGTYGEDAICSATSCYFDVNITNNYPAEITIYSDNLRATDYEHQSLIKSSNAFKPIVSERLVLTTTIEEKSFKCDYSVSEKALSLEPSRGEERESNESNETKTLICEDTSKDKVLFDKEYKAYNPDTKTFTYDEVKEVEEIRLIKENSKAGIPLKQGETATVRVQFAVPINSQGKFDVELDVEVDGEMLTLIYDPWWNTGNYQYRREIYNLTDAQPINASMVYSGSDIDSNGTDEWIYAGNCSSGQMWIYYNDSETFAVTNGTDECLWHDSGTGKGNYGFPVDGLVYYATMDRTDTPPINLAGNFNGTWVKAGSGFEMGKSGGKINNLFETGSAYSPNFASIYLGTELNSYRSEITYASWYNKRVSSAASVLIANRNPQGFRLNGASSSTNKPGFSVYTSDGSFSCAGTTSTNSGWHHIVGTWNGTHSFIYVDGVLENTCSAPGTISDAGMSTRIARGVSSYLHFAGGWMDDVRIYNRSLSETEVQELYEMGAYLGAEEEPSSGLTSITWNSPYNTTINTDSVTLNWTTDAGATNCNLSFAGTWYNQTNVSVGQTDWTQLVESLSEGNYTPINVSCNDDSDNVTSDNVWIYYGILPLVTWNWAKANTSSTDDSPTPAVTINVDSNCTLHFNGTDYPNATTAQAITFTGISGLSDGNYSTINVTCEDAEGNEDTTTNSWYSVDTIEPVLTWDWIHENTTGNVNPIWVNLTSNEDLDNCMISLDGASNVSMTDKNSTYWYYEWTLGSDGNSTVQAFCNDTVYNTGSTVISWYNLDSTPPTISWVSWTGYNDTLVTCTNTTTVKWETNELVLNCTLYYGTETMSNTTIADSYEMDIELPEGNTTLNVTCYDLAENEGTSTNAWTRVLRCVETSQYKWQIRLYVDDTNYVNSTMGYVGIGDVYEWGYYNTTCSAPSAYYDDSAEYNTTQTLDYAELHTSAITTSVPIYSIGFNLTKYGQYNVAYARIIIDFYDFTTEVWTFSLKNVSEVVSTERHTVTLDNYWFDVTNITFEAYSLNGDNVSISDIDINKTGNLGYCSDDQPTYLIFSATQDIVYVENQTLTNAFWSFIPYLDDMAIYLRTTAVFACIKQYAFYDGESLYDPYTSGNGTRTDILTYPNFIRTAPVADETYNLWHYISLSACDPGNLTTYNWSYSFVPVVYGIW
jgi:hypothetical protein